MANADIPRGKAAYKKKDGIITLTDDRESLVWTPLPGTGPAVVSLAVDNISNLQQTPDTAAKVMLKIFEKAKPDAEPVAYLFHFTSPSDARSEANALKAVLSGILADARSGDLGVPKPTAQAADGGDDSGSAAMSFASTANAKPAIRWFDDASLLADAGLQQSLLKKSQELNQIYTDARNSKPASISNATFSAQFWSTRVNLLRAHAFELNQKKGSINILSVVKARKENGEDKLNISVEQVQMIFQQHPLVKRIYNENVPKLSEAEFWSRFFMSRLATKLRGGKPGENEHTDPLFDKYNPWDNALDFKTKIMDQAVPHIIDLEGNEENKGGFKGGNRPDAEMHFTKGRDKAPIIWTLNSLSEKIMANVAPSDLDPEGVTALDETTLKEVSLRDLQGDAEAKRIVLNVQEQSRLFSNQASSVSDDAKVYEKQVPADVIFDVQADLETLDDDGAGGIDLHKGTGIDDDSDSEDDAAQKRPHVGSRAALKAAQAQILEGMKKKRAETYGGTDDEASPMGIPAEIAQRCYLTNATTTEFLKQFWSTFLSGDAARAAELAYHVEALRRSRERIEALAAEAEKERQRVMEADKERIREYFRRTGKKTRWRPESYKGGKDAVEALFEATLTSLKSAQGMYNTAVAAS
ncbi:hypothetical protein GQ53DRAFT_818115 [Thozetella sp. PMI_491]|nr:hypothetical protein GQ53DRAFT_818115 [Thozetella sp. PMI_491]